MERMYNLINKKFDTRNKIIVNGFDVKVNLVPMNHKQISTLRSKFNVHPTRVFVIEEIK